MLIRTNFDPRQPRVGGGAPQAASVGRRDFVRSTLAATAIAAMPGGRLWANAANSAALPDRLDAVSLAGKPVSLSSADIRDLRSALHGSLLLARDEGYESARRLWNPSFDRHPALIARCASSADVAMSVKFARTHQLRTAVRAGGHSLSGQSACDGGLMIDLQPMKGIRIDARKLRAQVQGGVLLGELDRSTQAAGLAITLGTVTDTGIAGLTLGGGLGRLMRRFGLTCDNLLGVDIVTADGMLRHASADENPDLFWALRGGGGNFGVVTSFEYRLHPFSHKVLSGVRVFPYSKARSVFEAVLDLSGRAPDDLMLGAELVNTSSARDQGRTALWSVEYTGDDPAVGMRLLEPLAKLGTPLHDGIAAVSYLAAQGAQGAANVVMPNNVTSWIETGYLRSTPMALIDEMIRSFEAMPPNLDASAGIGQVGGAVARVKPDATAYWNRLATNDVLVQASWTDRARDAVGGKATRDLWDSLKKFTDGFYVNTVPGADNGRIRATYGDNYARLVSIKEKYDPGNLFRMNANIKPGKAEG